MRSGGRLWMVTLENREPESYEELPVYFRTRADARYTQEEYESWRAFGEWPWRDEDKVVVRPAPDDVRENDIAWDDE